MKGDRVDRGGANPRSSATSFQRHLKEGGALVRLAGPTGVQPGRRAADPRWSATGPNASPGLPASSPGLQLVSCQCPDPIRGPADRNACATSVRRQPDLSSGCHLVLLWMTFERRPRRPRRRQPQVERDWFPMSSKRESRECLRSDQTGECHRYDARVPIGRSRERFRPDLT